MVGILKAQMHRMAVTLLRARQKLTDFQMRRLLLPSVVGCTSL